MSAARHTHSIRARWVHPVDRPPIEGGAIALCDGRIVAVGRASDVSADSTEDLGDCILLPGLVNAHTHLELGWCRGKITPRPLWDWFDELIRLNSLPDAEEKRRRAVADGAAESLAAGVTTVADISRTGMSAEVLLKSPVRSVCFVELISGARGLPNDAASLEARASTLAAAATDRRRIGISPHTPYSVSEADMSACADLAEKLNLPITTHLLETPDERNWYGSGGGKVAEYLKRYQIGGDSTTAPGDPLELLARARLLRRKPLLAHVNYVSEQQVRAIADSDASVVWCPRTHRYFDHAPHRWRDLLAAGVNVCIGTDSLASAPSLSILEELDDVAQADVSCPAETLIECATLRGAAALGLSATTGSLTVGKDGDLVALRWTDDGPSEPCENAIRGGKAVHKVWVGGEEISPSHLSA